MARILLVATNRERTPFPVMPVGAALVAAHAEREGHEARVLDLMFEEDVGKALARTLRTFPPDLIGVSMRNIDNSDLIETKYYVPEVEAILREVRQAGGAVPVVLGGAATSIEPEALLALWGPGGRASENGPPLVDLILTGDSEKVFPRLAERLLLGRDVSDLPGICRREPDGALSWNRVGLSEPVDGLADAGLFRFTDISRYERAEGVYPIQSRRGCAFTCTYCTYGSLEGLRMRFRSVGEVVDEIERAVDAGVAHFEFVDAVFSHPPAHARAICLELIARGLGEKAVFTASGFNPVGVTEDLLALMRKAGFRTVSATVEGASTAMLQRLRKGFDARDVENLARWLRNQGILAIWIFLIGSPGETRETVEETFEFIAKKIPKNHLVYITNGVRVYRGTGLHRALLAEGSLSPSQNLLEPFFVFSSTLPRDWYLSRLIEFSRENPNVVNSFEAGQSVVETLSRAVSWLPFPRPRWRLLPAIRRIGSPFRAARKDALTAPPWPVVLSSSHG